MKIGFWRTSLLASILYLPTGAAAQMFYPDDPLSSDPPPVTVESAGYRSLNSLYEYFANRFAEPGQRQTDNGLIPARGVNTLGEVPDGPWFVNRHGCMRMDSGALVRGSGDKDPPNSEGRWRILAFTKDEVLRPALWILDSDNELYVLKFDPPGHIEMATGAAMIGSRLFHAMGYWVPEHYLVYFNRERLALAPPEETFEIPRDFFSLEEEEIDLFLKTVPLDKAKGYRALAIKIPDKTEQLGPYQFHGTRRDDPNDIIRHEHRRDLRGLHVLSSWVGNNWIDANQTQDFLLKENNVRFIRHYIVDFLTLLGSGFHREKDVREGFAPLFSMKQALKNFAGFGIYSPDWQRMDYPKVDSIGRFESVKFDPSEWQLNYQPAAIANHLPDDDFWAAKLVMAFTDEDIRTIVETAQYSDPRAGEWIVQCLIERRDKVGRYYFERVLPLDRFEVEGTRLKFEDLAVRYGFHGPREYSVLWSVFDNNSGTHQLLEGQETLEIPAAARAAETGVYFSAEISAGEPEKSVTVYIRSENKGLKVVGIERSWPGKRSAGPANQRP